MKNQSLAIKIAGLLLFSVLFYLFVLQILAIWSFTIDDMYISLRYAKNWADGFGLVWNIGEPPVEGYSNFSFVVLARLALSWGYDPVIVLKGAGVLGLLCTCFAVYAISRLWFSWSLAIIPCVWLLAYKGQIIWTVGGLETTVYQALIAAAVYFLYKGLGYSSYPEPKENYRLLSFLLSGFLLVLSGMTRPEAPAFMLLFVVLLFVSRPVPSERNYWTMVAYFCSIIVICFAPYFFWRVFYYGRLFPNPVYCKGLVNDTLFMLDKNYVRLIWPFALLAIPAIWHSKDKRHYFLWLPSVVYLILLMRADPIVAFENRLFLPAFVLLLPLSLQGLAILIPRYLGSMQNFNLFMYGSAFLIVIFFMPKMTLGDYHYFTKNPVAGEQLRKNVIGWLEDHALPHSRVVLADSGLIPYKTPYAFIDSYCLNNVDMTKQPAASMYQDFCEKIVDIKPEIIILTALIENGKTIYTPADACLAATLAQSLVYCLQTSFTFGNKDSFYRYEIFSKSNKSCSKMHW